jgi:hypothetical protein
MRRLLAAALLLALAGAGCTWQASRGSQAVDVNPFALGSGEPVFSPAEGPGYSNGVPTDMRTRR